ncbi:hypothetical protein SELMODRAFT_106265, partial [Selaginella moellendorffii]
AYAQNGDVGGARRCFETMPARSSGSWRGLLWALARSGRGGEAMEMLSRMDQEGVDIQLAALAAAVSACKNLQQGIAIHEEIAAGGVECEAILATALINMFVKASQIHESWSYFQKLPSRSVVSWNAIIAAFTVTGHPCRALKCFGEMDLDGVEMDSITFVCAMYACSIVGELQICKILHAGLVDRKILIETAVANALRMPYNDLYAWNAVVAAHAQAGLVRQAEELFAAMQYRNAVSWNTMIAGYAQNGHHCRALHLFRSMDLEGVPPTKISFISSIDSCGEVAVAAVGAAAGPLLHAEIAGKSFEWDVGVATAVISMYGKLGLLDRSLAVFHGMPRRTVVPYNATAAALAENGRSRDALHFLHTMLLDAVTPSDVSFLIAIAACSHAGLYEDGLERSAGMSQDHGLDPSFDHYLCVVDLLGRAGQLGDAEELLCVMPYEPDVVAWTALLAASVNHCDVHRAVRAAGRVLELKHDPAAYSLLLNICSPRLETNCQHNLDFSIVTYLYSGERYKQ